MSRIVKCGLVQSHNASGPRCVRRADRAKQNLDHQMKFIDAAGKAGADVRLQEVFNTPYFCAEQR